MIPYVLPDAMPGKISVSISVQSVNIILVSETE